MDKILTKSVSFMEDDTNEITEINNIDDNDAQSVISVSSEAFSEPFEEISQEIASKTQSIKPTKPQEKYINTAKRVKKVLKKYNKKLDSIINKKNKIRGVIEEISKNKKLYFKDHIENLNFQIELLSNEYNYMKNLAYSFLTKYLHDLSVNGQHIIFLLTSLLNYNIRDNKNEILSRIKKIELPHMEEIKDKTISDLVVIMDMIITHTNYNISLINNFSKEYADYITKLTDKFQEENLHCNNLNTSYTFKKKQFDLEYEKNIHTLNNIHDYFLILAEYLDEQINNTSICNFCLEK